MNVFQFLRGFGPVTSGGTPPAAPTTFAVTDKGDGTGATAAVAGSQAGSLNRVYIAPRSNSGPQAFTLETSIAGDGSALMGLAAGAYLARCVSVLNSLYSLPTNDVAFYVTGGAVAGPTVAPTGHQGVIQAGIAWLIASSPSFQTLVAAGSASAALAHVPLEADDSEESGSTRPRAIVHAIEFKEEKVSLLDFRPSGQVWVSFEFPPSAPVAGESPRETRLFDERIEFLNRVDAILSDCTALQGTGTGYVANQTHVSLDDIELLDGPSTGEIEVRAAGQQGETAQYFWGATYCFHWRG